MKFKNCLKCGKKVSKNCHLGYCGVCRDRRGANNPFYGKKHDSETIEQMKIKNSEITKNKWKDENYRQKVIKGVSKPRRLGFKKEQSDRIKRWYKDNPNQIEIRSLAMKKSWNEGKIEPNINSTNESQLERDFAAAIKIAFPNQSFVKKTIKINKRWFFPDNLMGEKLIIEFFGDYWHANPILFKKDEVMYGNLTAEEVWQHDTERINALENGGFKVFVVWQKEWKESPERIFERLLPLILNGR